MRQKSLFFGTLLFVFLLTTNSCVEDTEPVPNNPNDQNQPSVEFDTKPINIQIPEGSGLNLSNTELMALGQTFSVDQSGVTKTVSIPGLISTVFLFDQDDQPVLAGFITDSTSTLSPESTAQVLLYYGLGLGIRDRRLTSLFIQQYPNFAQRAAWEEEFTNLWKSDPLLLTKDTYLAPLKDVVASIVPKEVLVDVTARMQTEKTSDITVEGVSRKSGMQVVESDLGEFKVENYYRRRAHAFLYKMSAKDESGLETILLGGFDSNTTAFLDFPVDPASAASSLTGILGNTIENQEAEFAMKESGPIQLPLEENESEAKYQIHIVGPGITSAIPKTQAEILKLTRLEVETFAIDFMFPLITEVFGWKDELKSGGIDIKNGNVEAFIEKTELLLKSLPDAYEEIKKGNYAGALEKTILGIAVGGYDSNFGDLAFYGFRLMQEFGKNNVDNFPKVDLERVENIFKKVDNVLKVVNATLLASDLIRIGVDFRNSSQFEEWTIRARSSKVTLLPQEAIVGVFGNQEIKAEIKNLEEEGDTHPYFVWKTSGNYGIIQDTKGNRGTSFESPDSEIIYYSNTSSANLPEENNFEYIYVEAYYKNQLIGRDTTKLNLRKSSYQLLPRGATVSGKANSSNTLLLSVEPVRHNQAPVDFSEMKIVWTTSGKHGKLDAGGAFSSTITTTGRNSLKYRCLDSETPNGTETVTARIYAKSAVDDGYFLFETLETTIRIKNDDKVIIMHIPSTYNTFFNEGETFSSCGAFPVFKMVPVENAEKYEARLVYLLQETIPAQTGKRESWTPDSKEVIDGNFEFLQLAGAAYSWPTWMGPPDCGILEAGAASVKATAEVFIYLKD